MSRNLLATGNGFEAKISAMRTKTGLIDQRLLRLRCAATGSAFAVAFTRESPAHRYRIAHIDKQDERGSTGIARITAAPAKQRFKAEEFDLSGWRCPWCNDPGGFVICSGCGGNVCEGRSRKLPHGANLFACHDGCGASFATAPCDTVSGEGGAARASLSFRKPAALSGPARRLLPNASPKSKGE